jgi:hypothetical protein
LCLSLASHNLCSLFKIFLALEFSMCFTTISSIHTHQSSCLFLRQWVFSFSWGHFLVLVFDHLSTSLKIN